MMNSSLIKKLFCSLLLVTFFLLFTECAIANVRQLPEHTLSPDLATGTAVVARKSTGAAELTMYPMTPLPTETGPIATMLWTPMPGEIIASDSGKSFDIWITSRVSIILNKTEYPVANLEQNCVPKDVLGQVSNIPVIPPDYYVIRYEGVWLGQCIIRNGQFEVTINVVNRP